MLRATLKGMLSRKLRLILSTFSVVLGVMFVSGSFVLTETLSRQFDGLFTDIYSATEIDVSRVSDLVGISGQPTPAPIPASAVDEVRAVSGVASATGIVFVDGAKVVDKNGKVVLSTGAPRFGGDWGTGETDVIQIREGRPPQADNEIMLGAAIAKRTGYVIGDTVGVLTNLAPDTRDYRLVGIFGYSSGRDSLAGESTVIFTLPVAQQLMLGETGVFSNIDVKVSAGADLNQVRDRIAAALGQGYNVKTGEQLASEGAQTTREQLKFLNYLLLGFAGVALFVGIFLILNTFLIIVAQRTKELALLRAMGASQGQVVGSVITEAAVIGLLASILGLGLGIGIGALLGTVLGGFLTGGALASAGLGVPPAAVISAFVVGVGVTVIAAVLPAIRAALVPPVAAMRESAATESTKLVRGLTIAGLVLLVAGGGVLWAGLAGALGDAGLWGVLGSVLVCFIAVTLLTPAISRPLVSVIGRLLSFSAAGLLGRRNSARNPVRTAITAAALMVSIALVTAVSLIFSSVQASTIDAIDTGVDAEIVIGADPLSGGLGSIEPAYLEEIRNLSEVDSVVGVYADLGKIEGDDTFLGALDDPAAAVSAFHMTATAGSLLPLGAGQAIVDDRTATAKGWAPGDTVTGQFARGEKTLRITGIYEFTAINNGIYLSAADATELFSSPAPIQAYVTLRPGADLDAAYDKVAAVVADSPEVSAAKMQDFIAAQAQIFDIILGFIQILLAMAMAIAVLGIVNTLALSMTERTRELGLLRAVGMQRRQIMWMVTVESVVISVFGALLGIVVGVGLGVTVFQALKEEGLTTLALPWPLMITYLFASVLVGLGAALTPAIRAARLDVLRAIAYE